MQGGFLKSRAYASRRGIEIARSAARRPAEVHRTCRVLSRVSIWHLLAKRKVHCYRLHRVAIAGDKPPLAHCVLGG